MTVVNLFEELGAVHQFEQPHALLVRKTPEAMTANKAVVLLVDDRAGTWQVNWEAAGMSNAEVIMALDILHRQIMDSILAN